MTAQPPKSFEEVHVFSFYGFVGQVEPEAHRAPRRAQRTARRAPAMYRRARWSAAIATGGIAPDDDRCQSSHGKVEITIVPIMGMTATTSGAGAQAIQQPENMAASASALTVARTLLEQSVEHRVDPPCGRDTKNPGHILNG